MAWCPINISQPCHAAPAYREVVGAGWSVDHGPVARWLYLSWEPTPWASTKLRKFSHCWWFRNPAKDLGCIKPVVNNGKNYQPQLVQDSFHQQYVPLLWSCIAIAVCWWNRRERCGTSCSHRCQMLSARSKPEKWHVARTLPKGLGRKQLGYEVVNSQWKHWILDNLLIRMSLLMQWILTCKYI